MSSAFDHFSPANDSESPECLDNPSYCDPDVCASYSDDEHEAVLDHARDLCLALYETLGAYATDHPETTYDVILHALDCMAYCLAEEMAEAEDSG